MRFMLKWVVCSSVLRAMLRHGPVLAGLLLAASAAAQTPDAEAGQEEDGESALRSLMEVSVSSLARKPQRLNQAAAAVHVLTREDIRRSGATTIPQALAQVPGLQVARIDANKWAVSSRGFNGRYANKMLVMIDGRTIYNNLFSAVYWEQNLVLLEDVERIEVIRGPGASLWGVNAVNGVINVITRAAKDSLGGFLALGTGTEEFSSTGFRYGAAVSDRTFFRISGRQHYEDKSVDAQGQDTNDEWHTEGGSFRLDFERTERESLSISADFHRGDAQQRVATNFPLTELGRVRDDSVDFHGGSLMAAWSRRSAGGAETRIQGYYDGWHRAELYARGTMNQLDLDTQHSWTAGPHALIAGIGYRNTWDNLAPEASFSRFTPESRRDHFFSAFLQNDITVRPERLVFSLGTKLESNTYAGFDYQPNMRALWTPTSDTGVWWSLSRATQNPSRLYQDFLLDFQVSPQPVPGLTGRFLGNPDLDSAVTWTYEWGLRSLLEEHISVDLAAFYNLHGRDIAIVQGNRFLEMGPPPRLVVPITFAGALEGASYGVEISSGLSLTGWWMLNASYSWLRISLRPGEDGFQVSPDQVPRDNQGASPRHKLHFRSHMDLPRRLGLDLNLQYVSALKTPDVPPRWRLDARLSWRPTVDAELSGGVRNLLDDRTPEFVPEDFGVAAETPRSAFLKLAWRF